MSEEIQGDQPINDEVSFSDDEKGGFDEVMSKKVDTLFAQKDHWRNKAKKQAEELEALRSKATEPPKEVAPKKAEKIDHDARYQRLELKSEFSDLSYDMIDKAVAFSKVQGKTPQEVIASDFFSGYVKSEADKKRAAEATPSPSNRSGSSTVDFEQVKSGDISKMSKEQFAKYKVFLKSKDSTKGGLAKHRRSSI